MLKKLKKNMVRELKETLKMIYTQNKETNYEKEPNKYLELKSIRIEVKISQEGFYSKFEQVENWTDEPKKRTIFTKSEKHKIKKNEQSKHN